MNEISQNRIERATRRSPLQGNRTLASGGSGSVPTGFGRLFNLAKVVCWRGLGGPHRLARWGSQLCLPRREAVGGRNGSMWGVGVLAGWLVVPAAFGAIGCTLANPARDLKALYPDMTSYREDVKELAKLPDGRAAYEALRARVGGDLDPVYEAFDVPYTLYSVFRGEEKLGYVHGVNVPGRGGVIQVYLAMDPETATIGRMFYQRLESPGGAALRSPAATGPFAGLSLADFYKHDYFAAADPGNEADRVGQLAPPAGLPEAAQPDWEAARRGVRKNLILLDLFAFDRRHEPFYERAQAAQREKEATP